VSVSLDVNIMLKSTRSGKAVSLLPCARTRYLPGGTAVKNEFQKLLTRVVEVMYVIAVFIIHAKVIPFINISKSAVYAECVIKLKYLTSLQCS
jgi:hypothetical protein